MKKIVILILISLLLMTGCSTKEIDKSIFTEPSGYTIAYITTGAFQSNYYGYIKNEDIEKYKNNEIRVLEVLYPYNDKPNKIILVETSGIKDIEFNIYEDYRNQ